MVGTTRGRGRGRGRGQGRGRPSNESVLSNSRLNNTTVGGLTAIAEDTDETLRNFIDEPSTVQGIDDHQKMLQVLIAYFNECQKNKYTHEQLLSKIKVVFNSNDKKIFAETIWRMMAVPFSLKPKRGDPCYCVNFFYKIINNVGTLKDYKESLENSLTAFEKKDILNIRILRLAQKYERESNTAIRFRIGETINVILKTINQYTELSEVFLNSLRDTCLLGLNDKDPQVRVKHAENFAFLNIDEHSKSVLFYKLQHDPHAEVRKAIIKYISLSTKDIPDFLELLGDENEQVQLLAIQALNKFPFVRLTINQRERIISAGLKFSTDAIVAATTNLLNLWLTNSCDGDPIKFIQKLDVVERKSVCLLALKTIYKDVNTDTFDKINLSFLENGFIQNDHLTPENAFFWWFLFDHFGSVPFCYEKLKVPIVNLISYVKKLMAIEHDFENEENESGKLSSWNLIISSILKIFSYLNPEEGERRELQKFIRKVFEYKYLTQSFLKPLMELFYISFPCDDMDTAIGDFIQSICINGRPTSSRLSRSVENLAEQSQKRLSDDEISAIRLKLGELTHEKHKLITEKQRLVEINDFLKAHNVQETIEKCALEVSELKNKLEESKRIEIEEIPDSTLDQDGELAKYPANTLKLILELLNLYARNRKMTNLHRTYYDFYVLKSIVCEYDIVRIRVLEGMTFQGLISFEDGTSAMIVNCQAVIHDDENVKIVAINGIFDLLLKWGFDKFKNNPRLRETLKMNEDETSNKDVSRRSSVLDNEKEDPLKILLFTQLRTKNVKMTKIVVRGFLRILLAGQIHSPTLINSFLLLWINPANHGTKLWREISLWLPVYASMGESQAELIAEGLIPSLKRIFLANPSSPMADAVPDKLIEFVLKSTDQVNFKKFKAPYAIHEKLTHLIIDELDKLHKGNVSNTYAKAVKWLKLENSSQKSIKKIRKRIKSTLQLQSKGVRTSLMAFTRYLNTLHPPAEGESDESDTESELEQTVIDLFESQEEGEDQNKTNATISSQDEQGMEIE